MPQSSTTGQLPAVVTIPDLPTGTTLTGAELLEMVQTVSGVAGSYQVPISQIMSTALGALPTGGGTGQILNKTNASNFSATWANITQFVAVGTGLATSGAATAIVIAAIGALTQRSVTGSPISISTTDQIINFNIAAGSPTCQLPLSSTRNGAPLTFQDVGGNATAHNLSFTFSGGELVDGQSTAAILTNYGKVTFTPLTDGVNTGWTLK